MRDPVLDEALRRLAAEAATRLSSLVAGGEEVPFDVADDGGSGGSPFYSYVPRTRDFVLAHEAELRSLPAFSPACGAVSLAGSAAPYLESRGEQVPRDTDERAARMLIGFVCDLWEGCTEFTLDRDRLGRLLDAIESETRGLHEADVLVAPLSGLQMPLPSLEMPGGVRLVRADTVDAPIEAMRSEGMGREPWEPQFLAVVEQGSGEGATAAALEQLHLTVCAMRLFKPGAIGLGPYAFAPGGGDGWRRVATGAAPALRSGSYELTEIEADDLARSAGEAMPRLRPALGSRSSGALGWALRRFAMGCERRDALEALSDHALALRAVLEGGGGPVGAPLAVRAAALIAAPAERDRARGRIEAALRLERESMAGGGAPAQAVEELATWLEDSVRGILRRAALGEMGEDAGLEADRSLLSAGLDVGEGGFSQRGDTDEWDAVQPEQPAGWEAILSDVPADEAGEEFIRVERNDDPMEEITRITEPIPGDTSEIRIEATGGQPPAGEPEPAAPGEEEEEEQMAARSDWLREVTGRSAPTIEWPGEAVGTRPGNREDREMARQRVDSPRVRHLFPVPEDADWSVRELDYDRSTRRIA